jgi:ribosome-binding factor A
VQHNSYKHERIESDILNVFNHTLTHEVYDPYLKKGSFTAVKLSPDNSILWVYVDTYDRKDIENVVSKLTIATSLFKNALAHSLKLRKIPDVRFIKDESIDNSLKIDSILAKIK